MIHSSTHDKRRQKSIKRELESERTSLEKKCKKLSQKEFYCQADAQEAIKKFEKANSRYFTVTATEKESPKYKRGTNQETALEYEQSNDN